MQYAYIAPSTNTLVITSLAHDFTLEQAINQGFIPKNKPLLKIENGSAQCVDDPTGYFYDAWELDNPLKPTKIVVNIEKAKEVWKRYLISLRNSTLLRLDGLQGRALGRGDTIEVQRIEQLKQHLRDMPSTINMSGIKTVRDLMEYKPIILFVD